MNKSQAVADLSIQLSSVTTAERAQQVIQRALRTAGLTNSPVIDEADLVALLQAVAAEGGAIQEIAEQIAVDGITTGEGISTDQDAA
jgi:hypothetical protein